jgi:hypothetical protein
MMHFSKRVTARGSAFACAPQRSGGFKSCGNAQSSVRNRAVRMKGTDAELLTGVALSRAETCTDGFYP